MKSIITYIKNPFKVFGPLGVRGYLNWLPDKLYLQLVFLGEMDKPLSFNNPVTYNEKLQWLKIHNRKPEYSLLVDKYEVRSLIRNVIGEEYLIPIYRVYNSVEEINWNELPNQFVLKCTHSSGSNIICTDKETLNIKESEKKLHKWFNKNWYWFAREWPYKNVKPRIICEKYMVDESGVELKDYKIFCFHGEPKIIQVDYARFGLHKRNLYDIDWNYLPASIHYASDPNKVIERPTRLNEMLNIARVLSKEHIHVRIDFYSIGSSIYFGEITFYPGAGFRKFSPYSLDKQMGDWIVLPEQDI